MKNLFNKTFVSILIIVFGFTLSLFATQQIVAQVQLPPHLPKVKDSDEAKGIAEFAFYLGSFYKVFDSIAKINTGLGTAEPDALLLKKLEVTASNVKSKAAAFGKQSEKLASKLPSSFGSDPSREEVKEEIDKLLGTRNVGNFFAKHGGKYILQIAARDSDVRRISSDIDNIIADPKKIGFYKLKFPCAVLATAIFGAELRKSSSTGTVDLFFKAFCGSSSLVTD